MKEAGSTPSDLANAVKTVREIVIFGQRKSHHWGISWSAEIDFFCIMKKITSGLFCFVIHCIIVNAQPELYAPFAADGMYGKGTILKFLPATNSAAAVWNFGGNSANFPYGHVTLSWNGKLYGMTSIGGTSNAGILFSYDPASASYSQVLNFGGLLGANPHGSLVQAKNGKLYGMTYAGGSYGYGVIFSFDPIGGLYSVVYHFDNFSGAHPYGSLLQASDGKLYGMTYGGGFYDGGVLFSFDPATGVYTNLWTLGNFVSTPHPYGSLIQAKDGRLYGMTSADGIGFGTIFTYDLAGATYKVLRSFGSPDGIAPRGDLLQATDGKLYGMTSGGGPAGSSSAGTIFSFDPTNASYLVLNTFTGANGSTPYGSLIQASDGRFYGMAWGGGGNNLGVLFSFVPSGAGGVYSLLWTFSGSNGASPYGSPFLAPDGKLYGMTSQGGSFSGGVLFAMTPLKGPYVVLKNFDGFSGFQPGAKLVQANDGKLYGMTAYGGTWNTGVIYSYDPATSIYAEKANFGLFGGHPTGSMVQATDGKLYGMTHDAGFYGYGSIISYDPSTGAISTLRYFDSASGSHPTASLIQAVDGKLYGMTHDGGSHNIGVMFSYDPVSGVYAVLKNFGYAKGEGYGSLGSLVQASNGRLYGVLEYGGTSNYGVIFSYSPGSATYSVLKSFSGLDGTDPSGSLIQASDGKLYGMTSGGGSAGTLNGNGVIYSFDPLTSGYSVLWNFSFATGSTPWGGLFQASDGKLYGMTNEAGANYRGTIFSWDPASSTYSKLQDLSISTGSEPWDDNNFIELRKPKLFILPTTATRGLAVVERSSAIAFNVTVRPNPSHQYFTLVLNSGGDQPVQAKVSDLLGRVIEVKKDLPIGTTWMFGASYRPGLYFCELVQGKDRVILKLIKD